MSVKKRKFEDTSMIEITIGDPVIKEDSREVGIVKDIKIVPDGNSFSDRSLIALLAVDFPNRTGTGVEKRVIATADKFEAVPYLEYNELYPNDMLFKPTRKKK